LEESNSVESPESIRRFRNKLHLQNTPYEVKVEFMARLMHRHYKDGTTIHELVNDRRSPWTSKQSVKKLIYHMDDLGMFNKTKITVTEKNAVYLYFLKDYKVKQLYCPRCNQPAEYEDLYDDI